MSKRKKSARKFVTVERKKYDEASLSGRSKSNLKSLQFVDEQILQKNNELQIVDSARVVYSQVLNLELANIRDQ